MIKNMNLYMMLFEPAFHCLRNTTAARMIQMYISLLTVSITNNIVSLFITLSISIRSVLKLEYLSTMWEPKYIAIGMKWFKAQVSRSFIGSFCL